MQLDNNVFISCIRCSNKLKIHVDEFEYCTDSYERNMGAEIYHEFYTTIECPNCCNEIELHINGFEYPLGAFNYSNYNISGGIYLQEPSISVNYEYYFDDDIVEKELPKVTQILSLLKGNPNYVYELSPREFEEVVAELFKSKGYEVRLTPQTRDGGRDIIVKQYVMGKPFVIYVECKKYGLKNKVSVDVIRELYGVQTSERVNAGMVVTTSVFSNDAVEFANKQGSLISLTDFYQLVRWIKEY